MQPLIHFFCYFIEWSRQRLGHSLDRLADTPKFRVGLYLCKRSSQGSDWLLSSLIVLGGKRYLQSSILLRGLKCHFGKPLPLEVCPTIHMLFIAINGTLADPLGPQGLEQILVDQAGITHLTARFRVHSFPVFSRHKLRHFHVLAGRDA